MNQKTAYWAKWLICIVLAGIFLVIPKNDIYDFDMAMFFAITVFTMAVIASLIWRFLRLCCRSRIFSVVLRR